MSQSASGYINNRYLKSLFKYEILSTERLVGTRQAAV